MFLKNEPFTFNGETITLFELSGLQRINHLAHLTEQAKNAKNALTQGQSEEVMTSELVAMNIRNSALLVAMSLWHNDRNGMPEKDLHEQVLSEWPVTAISEAENRVKALSGMVIPEPEEVPPGAEATEKVDDTPEKSLPAS